MKDVWKIWGEELEKLIGTAGLAPRKALANRSADVEGYWGFHQSIPVTLPGEAVLVLQIPEMGVFEDDVVALGLVDEKGVGVILHTTSDFNAHMRDVLSSLRDKKVYVYENNRAYSRVKARNVVPLATYWQKRVEGALGSVPIPWQTDYLEHILHAVSTGDEWATLRLTLSDVLRLYHIYLTYKLDPLGGKMPTRRPSAPAIIPAGSIDIPPLGKD